ncbi:G patch domain-containing protein TGH isoform X2 [Aristolochia californica]|uniref:G patch domain-containing protein TGH isoform X2 n=1 Tax=Aristolochia californica TaxID=171875 RepID=UPI0035D74A8B
MICSVAHYSELGGQSVGTSSLFDTFGFTAAEVARKQAEKELHKRPSAIPGPVPDELITPASISIGMKLLLKMGWRHGHAIKGSQKNQLYDARREARKAFLAFSSDKAKPDDDVDAVTSDYESTMEGFISDERTFFSRSTPIFVLNPKQDLHGLGFDPFKHAPEFRERKKFRMSGAEGSKIGRALSERGKLFASNSGKIAPGFGIGALEELDIEDDDIYASGFEFEEINVEEAEEPQRISKDNRTPLSNKKHGSLSGFKVATNSDYQFERYTPPDIPFDFDPYHKFPSPRETEIKVVDSPPEVPPPEDNKLRLLIDGFASLVSRCGTLFEDLSREKNKDNPLFSFLNGGNGYNYYVRKLWELQQKHPDRRKQQVDNAKNTGKKTAEDRGRILGEKPLERSIKDSGSSASTDGVHLQYNLTDAFTKPSSFVDLLEAAKPFKNDPAKQERFEQFLKDKYIGGLRSTSSGGSNNMSEDDRARERLDFEAAAVAIDKGELSKISNISSTLQLYQSQFTKGQFVSGGKEVYKAQKEKMEAETKYPRREEYQWRPYPLLCKRFDIIDPFMGKPLPLARGRSKMDSLVFMSDFVKSTETEETITANREFLPVSQSELPRTHEKMPQMETESEANPSIERPVDLYKAIFSDDSDDEEDDPPSFNQVGDTEKKTEVANTTLNRLIAGDFLESLGKELGLEVPPDPVHCSKEQKDNLTSSRKENVVAEDGVTAPRNDQAGSNNDASIGTLEDQDPERPRKGQESFGEISLPNQLSNKKTGKPTTEEMVESRKSRSQKKKHRPSSTSDSSYSSGDDYQHGGHLRSREDTRNSSKRKSRKHSKHHKHRSKRSSSRSHYRDSDSDDREKRQEKKKRRDDDKDDRPQKRKSIDSLKSSSHRRRHHH